MASYKITFKRSVKKDLRKIQKQDLSAILKRIAALADDPGPPECKKLSAKDVYRVRHGIYRIVYEIIDDRLIIIVVAVASRGSSYKQ